MVPPAAAVSCAAFWLPGSWPPRISLDFVAALDSGHSGSSGLLIVDSSREGVAPDISPRLYKNEGGEYTEITRDKRTVMAIREVATLGIFLRFSCKGSSPAWSFIDDKTTGGGGDDWRENRRCESTFPNH